jgi:protein-disulfide isomerase
VPVFEQLLEQYKGRIKVVFKQFPLRMHAFADKAARASIAAHNMGKFWEFHDLLFKFYDQLSDEKIEALRATVGLDAAQFRQEMSTNATRARIKADVSNGKAAGVRGTPTVFVNGKVLRNKSLKGFQGAIDAALKQ